MRTVDSWNQVSRCLSAFKLAPLWAALLPFRLWEICALLTLHQEKLQHHRLKTLYSAMSPPHPTTHTPHPSAYYLYSPLNLSSPRFMGLMPFQRHISKCRSCWSPPRFASIHWHQMSVDNTGHCIIGVSKSIHGKILIESFKLTCAKTLLHFPDSSIHNLMQFCFCYLCLFKQKTD